MSVLVISVVMVAMAPVITKRVSDNLNITGSGGGGAKKQEGFLFTSNTSGGTSTYNISCSDTNSSGTVLNHNICTFTIPQGVRNVNIIGVSGGGGGGSAARPYRKKSDSIYVTSNSDTSPYWKIVNITHGMRKVEIAEMHGAGGAGGGAAFKIAENVAPKTQSDCTPFNALFLKVNSSTGEGICMAKYNVGDPSGPIRDGMTFQKPLYSGYNSIYSDGCNGEGTTASSYTSGHGTHPVCSVNYSRNICKEYTPSTSKYSVWDLPTDAELAAVKSQLISNASTLNLCSNTTSKSPYCTSLTSSSYCRASHNGADNTVGGNAYGCYPASLWTYTKDPNNSNNYYAYTWSSSSSFTRESAPYSQRRSARCVLRNISQKITVATGSGGGGGSQLQDLIIPDKYIVNNLGGIIRIGAAESADPGENATLPNGVGTAAKWDPVNEDILFWYDTTSNYAKYNVASDEAFAQRAKKISYALIYKSATEELPDWGVALASGTAGQGADCTGTTCVGGIPYSDEKLESGYAQMSQQGGCVKIYKNTNGYIYGTSCKEIENIAAIHIGKTGKPGKVVNDIETQENNYVTGGGSGPTWAANHFSYTYVYGFGIGGDGLGYRYTKDVTSGKINLEPYGTGVKGTTGEVELNYSTFYPVSGGAGGGSGGMLEARNLPVETGRQMTIQIGKGGVGGGKPAEITHYSGTGGKYGISGTAGGATRVKYGNFDVTVNGGGGGAYGYYNSSFTSVTTPTGGSAPTAVTGSNYQVKAGSGGSVPTLNKDSSGNIISSWGGMGGKSPTGAFGGCGGLFVYSSSLSSTLLNDKNTSPRCSNSTPEGQKQQVIIPTDFINTQDYGQAGAGGGGGGWSYDDYDNPGIGGDGQPGYVYIWWTIED